MNQHPEQIARDKIDKQLQACGWTVQDKNKINWAVSTGIAVREYLTQDGKEADYVLFVDKKPIGIIEAKKKEEGMNITVVEEQSMMYAKSKLKYFDNQPLPFVYESTGEITRFTDYRDTKPRSRKVFTFHTPETLREWSKQTKSLRKRLVEDMPLLNTLYLRDCQINAINNLEVSFKQNNPKALIQMATGSGKTFTAITAIYRLLKFANAKRVLFLVDTRNLGKQALDEFSQYTPNDDKQKFTELYSIHHVKSSFIPESSDVCISTIQRFYAILQGKELDEQAEENNPNEYSGNYWADKEPMPVMYNPKIPIEFFDFIVIDECHRSIYNLWKQVLDYFDAFLIGLTATPDKRTLGFFDENIVSQYTHEQAVIDGVNVGYDVFTIETEITKNGAIIAAKEFVDKRHKLTRKTRWEQLDEVVTYTNSELDEKVVNKSQIRNIIKTFKEKLPELFPNRNEVPKTLIFAKTDSHADDIIQIVREEFAEGNNFCKKITYKAEEDPQSILAQFRNEYNPRIAVTVDMIATGTDVKPLECLIFMRMVKSRNYFEQMKGRGTRTLGYDDLKKVSESVTSAKTHFVIIDAVGVFQTIQTDSRPLERKKSVPLKDLLQAVMMGVNDEDTLLSLGGRLARIAKQMTPQEQQKFSTLAQGQSIKQVTQTIFDAFDEDTLADTLQSNPQQFSSTEEVQKHLLDSIQNTFTGELNEFIEKVRQTHEQIIDIINLDTVLRAEWDTESVANAEKLITDFQEYILKNKDEITALRIFYNLPRQYQKISTQIITELLEKIKAEKPNLAPFRVWQAYQQIEKLQANRPKQELIALVALLRRVTNLDAILTPLERTIDKNFQQWTFQKQAGSTKFTEEQMTFLRMIKSHIADNLYMEIEDLDYTPFDQMGGKMKMRSLFGKETNAIIAELNEKLIA